MFLFAIMTPADNAGLQAALNTHYADNYLKVGPGQYIVAGRTTAVELSNQLGITQGLNGLAIVAVISGYYGRTDKNIWDWMALKSSTP
jgi:hypothetical protein